MMKKKTIKYTSVPLDKKPFGVSLDNPLLTTDICVEDIEKLLQMKFEIAEEQCGTIRDLLVCIDESEYAYIHKWEYEEGGVKIHIDSKKPANFKKLYDLMVKLLELDNSKITWKSPYI